MEIHLVFITKIIIIIIIINKMECVFLVLPKKKVYCCGTMDRDLEMKMRKSNAQK